MSDKIKLVRNDTGPQIKIVVTDENTGLPVNISGAAVIMRFRKLAESTILATVNGILVTGKENEDGTYTYTAPYDVAGAGGRAVFIWADNDLDVEPGEYEGEVEITFSDGTVQTIYDTLRFKVRQDFA